MFTTRNARILTAALACCAVLIGAAVVRADFGCSDQETEGCDPECTVDLEVSNAEESSAACGELTLVSVEGTATCDTTNVNFGPKHFCAGQSGAVEVKVGGNTISIAPQGSGTWGGVLGSADCGQMSFGCSSS